MENKREELERVCLCTCLHPKDICLGSPLGELFDHGMDCVANIFFVPAVMITTLGGYNKTFSVGLAFICYFCFYLSHWVHYVTGTLTFGLIDITEIQVP